MANYSEGHICQCLRRLATVRRNAVVTISGDRRKTGEQFVEDVLCLAFGLLELGIGAGDVVAISALNSDLYLEWLLAIAFVGGIAAPLNYRWVSTISLILFIYLLCLFLSFLFTILKKLK
ncbi:hypothetical protein F2P56_008884 [Juglans regia]|uniref:AMP-dependent synthetase/ligase domain-containing protein n=1 Tax=Juglans regia TaxID=51240 RepID=A0A833XW21_JUGRE|nr:hypothetical protein F2P56_008884 [Juglans regia]